MPPVVIGRATGGTALEWIICAQPRCAIRLMSPDRNRRSGRSNSEVIDTLCNFRWLWSPLA